MNSLLVFAILLLFANFSFANSDSPENGEELSDSGFSTENPTGSTDDDYSEDEDIDQVLGIAVNVKYYSFMAALVSSANRVPFCAGTLYKSRYVITAAHCVAGRGDFYVVLNSTRMHPSNSWESSALVYLSYTNSPYSPRHIMPGFVYTANQIKNDIAVLDLGVDNRLSHLRSVVLAPSFPQPSYAGVLGTISGWGSSDGYNYYLRAARSWIIDNTVCANSMIDFFIGSSMMCARNSAAMSTCYGDDGGPIMYGGLQVGIVAKTPYPCATSTSPTIYSRTGSFSGWINSVAK